MTEQGMGAVRNEENEYPRELTYECPGCKVPNSFTDEGKPAQFICGNCGRILFSRTKQATAEVTPAQKMMAMKDIKPPKKDPVWDDISLHGRDINLTEEDAKQARRLLDW
jgi:uncharacterized Zn finger protein (UPF0148 family)